MLPLMRQIALATLLCATWTCAQSTSELSEENLAPSHPHYGEVRGNRVRLRVAPQLDAPIVGELSKGTPIEITGEQGEFYAVHPPFAMKAYLFRTYVLDGKVEGERVNVRLEPSPEATILTQVNHGYPIKGEPSAHNPKWLEIDLPPSVRFYLSKDYVQGIDQERYEQLQAHLQASTAPSTPIPALPTAEPLPLDPKQQQWQKLEEQIERAWLEAHAPATDQEYRDWQIVYAQTLEGVVELYKAPPFAPGDFLLRHHGRTIAILYSDRLELANYLGQSVRIKAQPRDNRQFAYPAYCVLSVEPK